MLNRIIDIILATTALIIFSPIILIIAILIWINLGRPVLFNQIRAGLHEQPFKLYKFRSMLDSIDKYGQPLPDDQRLTKFGTWLRRSSLDELPQLINILKGELSVVGPRPLPLEYLPLYNEFQHKRHNVKPGLTGWAQVNGRNSLSWEDKFKRDVYYVENKSLLLNFKIIFLTFIKVIRSEGISKDGHVSMTKFTGTPPEK